MERLMIAGCEQPAIFTPEAIDCIYRLTEGIPRLINNLCDNALLAGYAADLPLIGRKIIEDVAESFDMLPRGYYSNQTNGYSQRNNVVNSAGRFEIWSGDDQQSSNSNRMLHEGTTGGAVRVISSEENLIAFPRMKGDI
jgi:hypothetical protein